MKRLVIVGAGGYGREISSIAESCVGFGSEFAVAGFLDDDPGALLPFRGYPPILGDVRGYEIRPGDAFFVAIGNTSVRKRCAESLAARGADFLSLVHKTAFVGCNAKIGAGAFVAPFAFVSAEAEVGRHAAVFHAASIGHDAHVGDFAHVYSQCAVGGGASVGEGASVYPGSVVAPRVSVGDWAVVGAASAVFVDVPPRGRVLGNPAAPLE